MAFYLKGIGEDHKTIPFLMLSTVRKEDMAIGNDFSSLTCLPEKAPRFELFSSFLLIPDFVEQRGNWFSR